MMQACWSGLVMADSQDLVLVLTTERTMQQAETLAAELLNRRLVACVSLSPVQSLYHWDGALQRDTEVQLLLKTAASCLDALQQAVFQLHSYDTPEWIIWSGQASPAYGRWLQAELRSDGSAPAPSGRPDSGPPAG